MNTPDPMTAADYWTNTHGPDHARWRTGRRTEHYCSNQRLADTNPHACPHPADTAAIQIGDKYFDTGETVDRFRTAKLCQHCADQESA